MTNSTRHLANTEAIDSGVMNYVWKQIVGYQRKAVEEKAARAGVDKDANNCLGPSGA
ncbi:plasma membrane phosphate transporter Pho87 [Aspergillus luchuensis]|uniref:Plasma membrane phosphate transporter Pho87 n=1 Tax=Aspergillus kawachii TaxID=1069201 RepID=A0A146EXC3_ASPKA|nr:plasma membrane phosphate transporter Pho87 [Aspergillus luchuensis]